MTNRPRRAHTRRERREMAEREARAGQAASQAAPTAPAQDSNVVPPTASAGREVAAAVPPQVMRPRPAPTATSARSLRSQRVEQQVASPRVGGELARIGITLGIIGVILVVAYFVLR